MTILWCGGEEVDFPYLGASDVGYCDSNMAREGLHNSYAKSPMFQQITSGWVHMTLYTATGTYTSTLFGFHDYASNKGIYFVYAPYLTNLTVYLKKYNDVTLASASLTGIQYAYIKLDLQLINYGSNGTVNLYLNGTLVATYTGDISIDGISGFNCIYAAGIGFLNGTSEIIVADEDTRLMRLKTLAPSAAGDTNSWTGAYTDVDETTLSDADKIYSATNNADFQANLTGMPSGTWSVKAVKVAARCVDGSGSTGIQLGVKSGGTVASGDTQTASGYWQTKERIMSVNPVTGIAFTPAEIEALQINLRAKTL